MVVDKIKVLVWVGEGVYVEVELDDTSALIGSMVVDEVEVTLDDGTLLVCTVVVVETVDDSKLLDIIDVPKMLVEDG